MTYPVAKDREYQRELRARRIAAGLTSKGKPRSHPGPTHNHQTSERHLKQARLLGLEAITWMATKKWREPAYLLGLHAFAANLPLPWWTLKDHFSIATLVDALERERQQHFGTSHALASHG